MVIDRCVANWWTLINQMRWRRGSAIYGILHQHRRILVLIVVTIFATWKDGISDPSEKIRQRGRMLIPNDYDFWLKWMEMHLLNNALAAAMFSPHALKIPPSRLVAGSSDEYHATMWHNYLQLSQVSKPMCVIVATMWQSVQWSWKNTFNRCEGGTPRLMICMGRRKYRFETYTETKNQLSVSTRIA